MGTMPEVTQGGGGGFLKKIKKIKKLFVISLCKNPIDAFVSAESLR